MLSFFPRGVLDEILNLIESVSEGFPPYSWYTDYHWNTKNYIAPYGNINHGLVHLSSNVDVKSGLRENIVGVRLSFSPK